MGGKLCGYPREQSGSMEVPKDSHQFSQLHVHAYVHSANNTQLIRWGSREGWRRSETDSLFTEWEARCRVIVQSYLCPIDTNTAMVSVSAQSRRCHPDLNSSVHKPIPLRHDCIGTNYQLLGFKVWLKVVRQTDNNCTELGTLTPVLCPFFLELSSKTFPMAVFWHYDRLGQRKNSNQKYHVAM